MSASNGRVGPHSAHASQSPLTMPAQSEGAPCSTDRRASGKAPRTKREIRQRPARDPSKRGARSATRPGADRA
eukprot:5437825-Lingulodinium_polyedra.AAC.1